MNTINPSSHRITLSYDSAQNGQIHVPHEGPRTSYAYDTQKPISFIITPGRATYHFLTGRTPDVPTHRGGASVTVSFDASGTGLMTAVPTTNVRDVYSAIGEDGKIERVVTHYHPLVARCLCREQVAWIELWKMYEAVATRLVQELVIQAGFDPIEAEDIRSEIFMRFQKDGHSRLRSFRGSSDWELRAWLAAVARNFAIDYLKKESIRRRHERHLPDGIEPPDQSGPTEQEAAFAVDGLSPRAPESDVAWIRFICGLSNVSGTVTTLIADVSDRTKRRRSAELCEKYRKDL